MSGSICTTIRCTPCCPRTIPSTGARGIRWVSSTGAISSCPRQGFDKDIMRIFNRVGVKPHILPTAVDDPTVISMVEHGLGVSMMTELTLRGRGDGVLLVPVEPKSARELGMAVRAGEGRQASLQQFLECAQTVLTELEPK